MRPTLTLLLAIFITHLGYTQTGIIKGRVIDSRTFKPLNFATVYLNHTTIGTITSNEGEFELKLLPAGNFDLIVSYVGYQSYQSRIVVKDSVTTTFNIKLVPSTTNLAEVLVRGKKDDKWTATFEKFQRYFFGVSPYTAQCRIINPWALEFNEDKNGNITATASLPLQIENVGLGYNITCQLRQCVVGPTLYKIFGAYRFEEAMTMDTTLSALWRQRREEVYLGSTRHLLKTLIEKRTNALGYELYVDKSNLPDVFRDTNLLANINNATLAPFDSYDIVRPSDNDGQYIINLPFRTEVHYMRESARAKIYTSVPFPVSWLEVKGGVLEVTAGGVVINPDQLTILGAMGDAHIAELLPIDFQLNRNEAVTTKVKKQHSKLAALVERPYIMTDKPYYYPADPILFKAFFNYLAPAYRDSLSHVVNVELIDEAGTVLHKKIFPVVRGTTVGDFNLATTTPPGNYTIRAYTRWMMNFDSHVVFKKPIKVLPHDRLGVVHEMPAIKKHLTILTEKDEFEPREEIILAIEATNFYENLVAADLAVSVTDIEQAAVPYNETNILWHYPITTNMLPDTSLTDAKYLIQSGIDFKGRMVTGKKNKPTAGVLTVYQENVDDVFAIPTDENGYFHQELQLMDSVELLIDARTQKKNKKGKLIVEEVHNPAPVVEVADTLVLDTYRPADRSKYHVVDLFSAAKMLEEVTIRARKIEETSGSKHLVSDTYIDIERLRTSNATDLLTALRGMVPGLRVLYFTDGSGSVKKIVCLSGAVSFSGPQEALVEVDGLAIGSGMGESAADILSAMTVEQVESVEVIRYATAAVFGARAANGVIVVKTRRGERETGPRKLDRSNLQAVKLPGYSKVEDFVAPDYSAHSSGDERLDLRSTIYWDPYVIANGKDPVKISFFAADIPTRYRIVVEGITADGEAVRGEKIIVVRSKK